MRSYFIKFLLSFFVVEDSSIVARLATYSSEQTDLLSIASVCVLLFAESLLAFQVS